MKCSCCFILALLSLGLAAPYHETDLKKAKLQRELEDEMTSLQLALEDSDTDMPKALPVGPLLGLSRLLQPPLASNKLRSSQTQTFLPQDVQDRYNNEEDDEKVQWLLL